MKRTPFSTSRNGARWPAVLLLLAAAPEQNLNEETDTDETMTQKSDEPPDSAMNIGLFHEDHANSNDEQPPAPRRRYYQEKPTHKRKRQDGIRDTKWVIY
ncbi:unnamed protein product [Trichogramma brassicae]|uniref:Uncharacterized protein n=1 Tax=Trichogramma brassicae TaxID=86971 RepID=A0A6H5HWD7_9HYME|nr:unnamed protein product [Trichogramma brassicae]